VCAILTEELRTVSAVTPERQIVAAFRSGMSIPEIARRSGLTPALVRTVLGDAGLVLRPHGRRWPYDARTEPRVAGDYASGATMPEIVARYGGNHRSIHHVLEHRGVRVRPAGRRPKGR
jgi:hypothetical protein